MLPNGGGKGGKPPAPGIFDMDEDTLTRPRPNAKPTPRTQSGPAPRTSGTGLPRSPAPPGARGTPAQVPRTTTGNLPRTTTGNIPRTTTGSTPRAGAPARANTHGILALEVGPAKQTEVQKNLQKSNFEQRASFDRLMGEKPPSGQPDDDDEAVTGIVENFDGEIPAPEVTGRDLWTALHAPVQSRENRRSKDAYRRVIDQFAVHNNPRYEPDGDKPRAHIFVWDVTRAMNVEIPHFVGPKEMTLAQTVDWIRLEGPMRGWRRVSPAEAIQAAQEGFGVVAVPKDPKSKMIAMVRPAPAGPDGQPRFASAGKKRGGDLSLLEALGAFAAEYFAHP